MASARDGGAAAMAATADGQGGTMCCGPALAVARAAAAVARHNAADIGYHRDRGFELVYI